jgi:predicted esterase
VARAQHDLDRAWSSHRPADEAERARVHRAADEATKALFRRDLSRAVQIFNETAVALEAPPDRSDRKTTETTLLLRALRVRVAPHVALQDRPSPLRVRVGPMYAPPIDRPITLRLIMRMERSDRSGSTTNPSIMPDEGEVVLDREFELERGGMSSSLTFQQPDAPPGRYRVELHAPDGHSQVTGHWYVAGESLDLMRQAHERRLMRVPGESEQMTQAVAAVMSRNSLLTMQQSEVESSRFLIDLPALAREVSEEVAQLEADRDPFVERVGDYWRTVFIGSLSVPMRVYAPDITRRGTTLPLVIALRGAGGDESTFIDMHGGGAIKRLSEQHGFLVVAPSSDFMLTAPQPIDGLLRALKRQYLIDEKQVYLIGHSHGALAAQTLAEREPQRIAAVCMVAGAAPFTRVRNFPRLRLVGAELDPIVPIDKLRSLTRDAREAGIWIEFIELKGSGHTLAMADDLPDAIAWLLGERDR